MAQVLVQKKALQRWIGVVDPCNFGRMGLMSALQQAPWPPHVAGFASLKEALTIKHVVGEGISNWDDLVVRLPPSPKEGLSLLLQLGELAFSLTPGLCLFVLSPLPAASVSRVLKSAGASSSTWVLDARLSVAALQHALCPTMALPDLWGNSIGVEEVSAPSPRDRLTRRERQTLWQSLQEIPIHLQARQRVMSQKTLYSQRARALSKLGASHLHGLLSEFSLP